MRTPGGHHRFRLSDVEAFMEQFTLGKEAAQPQELTGDARA